MEKLEKTCNISVQLLSLVAKSEFSVCSSALPRPRKGDLMDNTKNRYLHTHGNGDESGEQQSVTADSSLSNLKSFLEAEFQVFGSDLKELKDDYKTINTRLTKIEGRLSKFETTVWQQQSVQGAISQTKSLSY